MRKTAPIEKKAPLKKAFLHGFIRMAREDADAVKQILIDGDFVQTNDDGSIDVDDEGRFRSCLLPTHAVEALGLLVRIRRWELLKFRVPREVGLPTSGELLEFIGHHLFDVDPPAEYARWAADRLVVFRDHAAWLAETELVVQADSDSESDDSFDAIADFLIAASSNIRNQREP